MSRWQLWAPVQGEDQAVLDYGWPWEHYEGGASSDEAWPGLHDALIGYVDDATRAARHSTHPTDRVGVLRPAICETCAHVVREVRRHAGRCPECGAYLSESEQGASTTHACSSCGWSE